MGRKPTNNPRQLPLKSCGCATCTAKFRPGEKATRRDCTGNWQYRYNDPSGKGTSVTRARYDDAVRDGQAEATKVKQGNWIDPARGQISLTELWGIYQPLRERKQNATRAKDGDLWRVHIEPRFGGWPINSIGYEEIQAWVNDLCGVLAASSVVKVFQILDRMLALALRSRRLPYNAADGIELPKIHSEHPEDRRPPTYEQLRRVRQKLPRHYRVLQIVAQETGMRWGELAGLRACWVDLTNARIQVREVLEEVRGHLARKEYPKEDASMRTVPLTPRAVGALRWLMDKEKPSAAVTPVDAGLCPGELVFRGRNQRNRKGEPYRAPLRRSTFRRAWIAAITAAGVVRTKTRKLDNGKTRSEHWPEFRDQRTTVASALADLNVPEVIVQELLGHKRASNVTWLYTYAANDAAGQVLAAMADRRAPQRAHLRVVA